MQFNQVFRSVRILNKSGQKNSVDQVFTKRKESYCCCVPFSNPYNNLVGKRCFGYLRGIIVIYWT